MLNVITASDAEKLLLSRFTKKTEPETVTPAHAMGRRVFEAIKSEGFVPDFHRSTVDGYAVCASDTFGCSETLPALLRLTGRVEMGREAGIALSPGETAYVPTGGELPRGADAMVMLEYAEDMGGDIAVMKPTAPGAHIIFRGDDVRQGETVFPRGRRLRPKDAGALAAMGKTEIPVFKRPKVAVISTGDELVPADTATLKMGQIRDVNGSMLAAAIQADGGECVSAAMLRDDPETLRAELSKALESADMVLVSGGSSVGEKDAAAEVLSELGELLFHGLALKPGKPTMAADVGGKPVFGLPGHPVAAYFVYELLVRPALYAMNDSAPVRYEKQAVLTAAVPSNHGREECVPVSVSGDEATPIRSKSGLITTLSGADGYIRVPRDTEGVEAGQTVRVCLFSEVL